jgi:hypothetical protein
MRLSCPILHPSPFTSPLKENIFPRHPRRMEVESLAKDSRLCAI